MNVVQILGHRGIRQDENPEKPYQNTIEAINYALENKADGIELDVWASKDGICYVIHDDDISLHGGEKIKITESKVLEIEKARIGKGNKKYKIPQLRDIIEIFKTNNKTLNIEIKQKGISHIVLKEIKEVGEGENIIMSSFYHENLADIRTENKDITVGLLFDSKDGNRPEYYDYLVSLDKKLGNAYLIPNCYTENERILNWEKEKYFWTIKKTEIEQDIAINLLKYPKTNFITDYPEILAPIIKRKIDKKLFEKN